MYLHPNPKGNQSWVFIGRTDVEAETPIFWPPDAKSWLIWKDPDFGKDWRQEEKGMTEDEMVGWHHRLNGHGFGWTLGVGDGQGGLVCCGSWVSKNWTQLSNWTELNTLNLYSDVGQLFLQLSRRDKSPLRTLRTLCFLSLYFCFSQRKIFLCPPADLNWKVFCLHVYHWYVIGKSWSVNLVIQRLLNWQKPWRSLTGLTKKFLWAFLVTSWSFGPARHKYHKPSLSYKEPQWKNSIFFAWVVVIMVKTKDRPSLTSQE